MNKMFVCLFCCVCCCCCLLLLLLLFWLKYERERQIQKNITFGCNVICNLIIGSRSGMRLNTCITVSHPRPIIKFIGSKVVFSRTATDDLTDDLTVLSRIRCQNHLWFSCEATTSKSIHFTTDPTFLWASN